MNKIKTVGIVLKTMDYKENDKIVTLYSEGFGKISILARGVKKNRNKNFSLVQSFCYGEYILYKGRDMYTLEDGFVIENFRIFTEDLTKLAYCSYFCELLDISCIQDEKNQILFKELITAIYILKLTIMAEEELRIMFELKVLYLNGFSMEGFENYSEALKKVIQYILNNPLKNLYKLKLSSIIKKQLKEILKKSIDENFIRRPKSLELLNYFL